jgi:AmmeMemoRadiSam system protein A
VLVGDDERDVLLDLARAALARAAGTPGAPSLPELLSDARAVEGVGGAFVTLHEEGELRGCMGSIDPSVPVGESVVHAALWAAAHDPRFRPVSTDELPRIRLDVSVLGPFTPIADPDRFRVGVEGIAIERGAAFALLLPEVATDHDLDAEAMLATVCRKAGLPGDAWRDRRTRLLVFRTTRFGGPAVAERDAAGVRIPPQGASEPTGPTP